MERSAGILLPIFSLPGAYGAGVLGTEAREFVDFLHAAGQKWWQILPIGPTGAGNSPYTSESTFAGNPLLIDLERLAEEGASLPRCWRESVRTLPEPLGKLLLPLGPLLPEGGGPLAQAVEETREELTGFLREETARQASQGRINAALSMAGACLAILVLL